jgi:peroxiredoxin Q/BCP
MLKPGTPAPAFTLPDENGDDVSLADLVSAGPLILYFYPADFTPGCTKEACDIRDLHGKLSGTGLQVVGVSPQDGDSHRRFREQHGLPFKLLSDEEKSVARMYDADGPLGIGVRRVTYLIDKDGTISDAVQADLRIGKHREFIEKAIAAKSAS